MVAHRVHEAAEYVVQQPGLPLEAHRALAAQTFVEGVKAGEVATSTGEGEQLAKVEAPGAEALDEGAPAQRWR